MVGTQNNRAEVILLWFQDNLHYLFLGVVLICILFIISVSRIIRAREARLNLKKQEIAEKHFQWEKAYYLQHFDRSLEELSGMPGNTEIGPDGLPCERGTSSWGKTYTFYRSHDGTAYHSNPSCSSRYGLLPVHAWTVYNSSLYPCGNCNPILPDLRWFSRYKANQTIANKYGIIPPPYVGPSSDYIRLQEANKRIQALTAQLSRAQSELQHYHSLNLENEIKKRSADIIRQKCRSVLKSDLFRQTLVSYDFTSRLPIEVNSRLITAFREKPTILPPLQVTARIQGHASVPYVVTMNSCTCKDFEFNHKPCKHMYTLALSLGLLLSLPHEESEKLLSRYAKNTSLKKKDTQ